MLSKPKYFQSAGTSKQEACLEFKEGVELAANVAFHVAEATGSTAGLGGEASEPAAEVLPAAALPRTESEAEEHIGLSVQKTARVANTTRGLSWFLKARKTDTTSSASSAASTSSPNTSLLARFGLRFNGPASQETATPLNEKLEVISVDGKEIIAVKEHVVQQSIQKIAGMTLMARRLGTAAVHVSLEPVEVGYLKVDPSITDSRPKPVYRLTFSCKFGTFDKYIIDDAKVKAVFWSKEEDTKREEPLSPTTPRTPIKVGGNGMTIETKSALVSKSTPEKQPADGSPTLPKRRTSQRANSPIVRIKGAPEVFVIAPEIHHGKPDIMPVERDLELSPQISTSMVQASAGKYSAKYKDTYHYHWSVTGMREQSTSCNDTVRWRMSANPQRTDGVPPHLRFVALVGHDGETHKPLCVTLSVRWALRTKFPNVIRSVFGWEDKCEEVFDVDFKGTIDPTVSIIPGTQAALDDMLKETWDAIHPQQAEEK